MTLPSPWALLLYACTKTVKPFLQSLFHPYTSSRKCHFYRTRQAWICSCDHFRLQNPCRKTSLPSIADKATADNPVLRQCTTGGTPVTASHARMTMTVTGFPHGGRKANFPLICSTALNPSTWRSRQYICPFSFPPLYAYASVSMPPSRTASGVIFVAWGKGKDGIRNSNFLSKNLHALSGVVFCLKKFANPTP